MDVPAVYQAGCDNGNLAVPRCALIALKSRLAGHLSWPALFELATMKPPLLYDMVCKNTFK